MRKLYLLSLGLAILSAMWSASAAPAHASRSDKGAKHRHVLKVGPGRQYATPQAAYNAASPGDLLLIHAALYQGNDAKMIIKGTDNVTFRGVGGRPHMKLAPTDRPTYGKGIWVDAANNIKIENIEFSGARMPTPAFYPGSGNGAGIRIEPINNLTIRRCYFHDNDMGILGGGDHPNSHIIITRSEFTRNGHGAGYSHDIYISGNPILTFRYNYIHGANNGNELKTRAHLNYIQFNRITYGNDPNYVANYNIDIPDGGVAYVNGNYVQQAAFLDPNLNNNTLLTYGEENLHHYAKNALYVTGNIFVNNAPSAFFLRVQDKPSLTAINEYNVFSGIGTLVSGSANVISKHNYRGDANDMDIDNGRYGPHSPASAAIHAGLHAKSHGQGYKLDSHPE